MKSEQKLYETSDGHSYNQSQVANLRPSLQASGQQQQPPTNVYVTAQQYLQQHQHSQPPFRNQSVQQGTALASHPQQPHFSSRSVSQSTSGFRAQQPANPYLAQQQLAGRQLAYGNGQAQPVQQHAVTDADSRKRKVESTQVLSRLMCCCLLDTLNSISR